MHLVIQTAFLGDMILTTPLIEWLARTGPVDVVATPANAPILANNPHVRDVILFDKRRTHRGWRGLRQIARVAQYRMQGGESTPRGTRIAYMAQGSARSAAIARLARIPRIVGFATSAGRWLYTDRVPYTGERHHVARLLMLSQTWPMDEAVPRPRLYPGAAEEEAARTLLLDAGVGPQAPIAVLAPGSIWATKRWPYFEQLASLLAQNAGMRIVIVGGAADNVLASTIAAEMRSGGLPEPIDATGRLSLLATAALMERAQVVVTNDSAPMHLASAMNVPTVALFGPTVPAFGFGPLAERRVVVQHETLSCRPCDSHGPRQCPLGHWKCMREVGAERVADAVHRLSFDGAASEPLG